MTKISEPIECLSASIFSKIDDDDFKTLKAIFTASGRGRRPSMPNLCLNNKLLLQLYFLKDDGTWNDLLDFAVYYIDIQKSRIKGLLLKVYKEVLTVKEEDHISYLANEVTFVGKYLLRFSITRHELLGDISNKKTVPVAVTNGILLDLIQFQKREDLLVSWIPQAVSYLSGDYSNQLCQKQIKNITTIAKKKSQNRSRDPVGYETFMSCKVFDGIESALLSSPNVCNIRIETETSPHTPICPTPKTPCRKRIKLDSISEDEKTNNENSPLLSASKAVQIRKIKGQLESAVAELKVEKENNRTLQQLLTERMRKMKSEEEKTNVLLNKNEKDIVHLKEELNKTRQQVEDRNKLISSIRQAPFYKRMKRWEENLREKEQEMTKDQQCKAKNNRTVQILKKKLKKTQTLLSNLRATNNKVKSEKLNLFDRIDQLEKEFLKDQKHPPIIMRDQNSNKFTNSVILCVVELIGKCEVSGKNCSAVIDVVSRHLFDVHIKEKDLPSERTSLRFADKGHILAQHQIADTLLHSSNVDLHSDGTSRDHNKVLGHQFTTNDGKILSCGFAPVFKEDTDTLVDVAFNMLKELADVYDGNEADAAFKVMLKNITGLMSDRASVMKSFDKSFNLKRQQTLHTDEDSEFLHCNAHFLLGLSSASEKILRSWSADEKLGRDKSGKFKHFSSSTESAAGRFIRTACDVLGPRGDEKNGCRDSWEAFCLLHDSKSTITSFRGNRFNNFFQASASLHHHRTDIINFLKNYLPARNLKQESVLLDAECDSLDAMIVALGIIYHKITGPYWMLIGSEVHYLHFYIYNTELHTSLTRWSDDASELIDVNHKPLFNMVMKTDTFQALYALPETQKSTLTTILQKLCSTFLDVTQRQLCDFLEGGRYYDVQDEARMKKMNHSKITNLIGEECFGDLDFSIFKRRNSSLHHHSTVNMLKRNNTFAWFDSKSTDDQNRLPTICSAKSQDSRNKHQEYQKAVLKKRKDLLIINKAENERKAAAVSTRKATIAENVKNHGGPCFSPMDVENLLKRLNNQKSRLEAMKEEIRYQKDILGLKHPYLRITGSLECVANRLKAFLGNTEVTTEVSTAELPVNIEEDDSEFVDDNMEIAIQKSQFGEFTFSKQGQYVAVFYDNDFYVGQVLDVTSSLTAEVKFLEKCRIKENTYKWPATNNVETVSVLYVIDWGFDMCTNNGRIWSIDDMNMHVSKKIMQKYRLYKELYC